MKYKHRINVFSEIGNLKAVLVHRPGDELENLVPGSLERLLFDDIPFKKVAIEEHNQFTNLMRKHGVEVLYIEELTAEALTQHPELKARFIQQFLDEANITNKTEQKKFTQFLKKFDNLEMVKKMISGTQKTEVGIFEDDDAPFLADPLPNVLFQRDPFASVGKGITMNRMWAETRNRETIFPDFVFKNHSRFTNVPYFYERDWKPSLEGGDVLVLNHETLIVGVSQRTTMGAVEIMSKRIFTEGNYKKIIVLDLPKSRAFMHLDTVFTNIDYDKFLVHPLIFDYADEFKIYELTEAKKTQIKTPLLKFLEEILNRKVTFIRCGGDDPIAARREQWNDGTNVLTIKPGVVIAYERNHVTIDLLKKAGVKVLPIASSELSRGRGGPRCMAMPLLREDLKKN